MAAKTVQSYIQVGSLALIAALALITTGCEQESDRTLAQAQACLDQATTAAAANACAQKVAGIESKPAYLIRCSANFISQGFTGDRIAKAYERLTDGGSGVNDPTLNLMAYLIFQDDSLNSVENTVKNCLRSGSTSMERLARIADLATSSAKFGNLDFSNFDPAEDPATLIPKLQDALDDAATIIQSAPAADVEKFGNLALSTAQSLCVDGSSFSTNDVCSTMNSVIAAAPRNSDGSVDVSQLAVDLLARLSQK